MDLKQFRNYVRRAFRFLIDDYEFSEVPLPKGEFVNEYMVCFSNGVTWVGIEGIHWGFGVDVRLASNDPAGMRYPTYCLADLLTLRAPEIELITAQGSDTKEIQKKQIDQYAEALRQYAADVLRGDFGVFPLLAKAIDDRRALYKQ